MLVALAAMVAARTLPPALSVQAATVGAAASGAALWAWLPGRRWIGALVGAVLLLGVAGGASVSPWAARWVPAGLAHLMLYAVMATTFGLSLRRAREALLTTVARRHNPHFRAGMVPYTRAITLIWCGFGLLQLGLSALLLAIGWWTAWQILVGGGHTALAALLLVVEFAVRHRTYPGEHTGFWDSLRGVSSSQRSDP